VAEPRAAGDPLEESERGGRVGWGDAGGGAEEVGDVPSGDGGGQALEGSALVPAARGENAAELRDDVGGGGGGTSGVGKGRETARDDGGV
jgi:hypothetical protein